MIPHNLLPEEYARNAFIAGGYAALPSAATDIDVWVSVQPHDLADARTALLRHLHEQDSFFVEEQGDEQTIFTISPDYELNVPIRKVAKVRYYRSELPYHILVVGGDVDATLRSFDISTHQIALTPWGVVRGENWTSVTVPPLKLRDTPTTDERMEKIAARYAAMRGNV